MPWGPVPARLRVEWWQSDNKLLNSEGFRSIKTRKRLNKERKYLDIGENFLDVGDVALGVLGPLVHQLLVKFNEGRHS